MSTTLLTSYAQQTIGQIVAEDYRAAEIFRSFSLDFCCGGNRTIADACASKKVSPESVYQALESLVYKHSAASPDYINWDAGFLADYIVNVHHSYVLNSMPLLRELSLKVARVHGEYQPELVDIAEVLHAVLDEMTTHMVKEEQILFPYIKALVHAATTDGEVPGAPFSSVEQPIAMMEKEHDVAGSGMERIRELTNGYEPPRQACASYRVLFSKLQEFERDLHKHIHLENNILFPKAKLLEKQFQLR